MNSMHIKMSIQEKKCKKGKTISMYGSTKHNLHDLSSDLSIGVNKISDLQYQ